jgi:hypothetical protein
VLAVSNYDCNMFIIQATGFILWPEACPCLDLSVIELNEGSTFVLEIVPRISVNGTVCLLCGN